MADVVQMTSQNAVIISGGCLFLSIRSLKIPGRKDARTPEEYSKCHLKLVLF